MQTSSLDVTDRSFTDCPGYHAIFMQVQGTIWELEELEHATDLQLIRKSATSLSR